MKRSGPTHTEGVKKCKISDDDIICLDDIDAEPNKKEMEKLEKLKKMSSEERKQYMKNTMEEVVYDEYADYEKAKKTAEMITAADRLLMRRGGRLPTEECDDELVKAQALKVIFQVESYLNPGKDVKTDVNPIHKTGVVDEKMLNDLRTLTVEECAPPKDRILITSNITLTNNAVPVYCDMGNSVEDTVIPDTFMFDHITKNTCDMSIHPQMEEFIAESQKQRNRVSCDCKTVVDTDSKGPICHCSKNHCPCVRVNRSLQKKQKKSWYRLEPTEIGTNTKLKINDLDDFYDTFGFNCSEQCACKGRCNNNASYILQQNAHRLELYRSGPKGFGIRTRAFIPAYTPVLEFIGEICRYEPIIESGSLDYSLLLHHKEDVIINLLKEHTGKKFGKKFVELMEEVWKEGPEDGVEYFINPKQKGNLGRFFSHSCFPNLAQVRIFTRSFTPADMKIVLVSTQDIYPGEELTFSYGPGYVRDHFPNGGCLCGTIPCPANKHFTTFKDANYATFCQYFREKHQEKYSKFKKYLIDGEKHVAPAIEVKSENENVPEEQKEVPDEQKDDKKLEESSYGKIDEAWVYEADIEQEKTIELVTISDDEN